MKVALIACCSKKLEGRHKAEDLYQGTLFNYSLKIAKATSFDKIYILSAKYFMITLDEEIENYNLTLNNFSRQEKRNWASTVIEQMKEFIPENTELHYFAGKNYYQDLPKGIARYKGKGIGHILKYIKTEYENLIERRDNK